MPFLGLPVESVIRTFALPILFMGGTAPGLVRTLPVLWSLLTPGSFLLVKQLCSCCSLAAYFFALSKVLIIRKTSFSEQHFFVTQQNFFIFAFVLKLQRDFFFSDYPIPSNWTCEENEFQAEPASINNRFEKSKSLD